MRDSNLRRAYLPFCVTIFRTIVSILMISFLFGCSSFELVRDEDPELVIAFGSCIQKPDEVPWDAISSTNPSIFIFLGDNIYLPNTTDITEETARKLYAELRNTAGFQKLSKQAKILSIWDDHDFGPDDSDSTSPTLPVTLKAFREFWGVRPPVLEHTSLSVASRYETSLVSILLTDNRAFRLNPHPDQEARLFGREQLQWITKELAAPRTPVVILASGGQLFSAGHSDSAIAQFPAEAEILKAALSTSPAHALAISGDRHYGELLKIPTAAKSIYEITSSPLAARFRHADNAGTVPERIRLVAGRKNFGLLRIKKIGSGVKVAASLMGADEHGKSEVIRTIYSGPH